MKVLIVDDNEDLTSMIQAMLENENHRIRRAGNGEEGYSAYFNFRPDLVITDIQMPGKNGFELIKAIRMHNPKIRTIYMSGNPIQFWSILEKEKKKYRADFLEKPFCRVELIRLLSKILN